MKKIFVSLFSILLCAIIFITCHVINKRNLVETFVQANSSHTIIIDAGHGGIDGGAVGHDGIIEKDINLQIALKLKTMLKANGYNVIMTREDDVMLKKDGKTGKVADMHARLEIVEKNPNSLFLSIHQNLFSQDSSWGAQVFYSPNNPDSKVLAEFLQARFVELLQPNNKRVSKQTDSSLFLFKNAYSPSVLIECGFLSNALDAKNLCDDEYQNKIVFVIFSAICDYYSYNLNT